MNEPIRVQRPAPEGQSMPHYSRGNGKNLGIIIAAVIIILLAGLVLFRDKLSSKSDEMSSKGANGAYQAVFLSNGQVYFGKLMKGGREYLKLSDIFYLQVTPVQGPQTEPKQQPQLQLVKLGNELHGPVDEMSINKEHVLFFEDLKDDGKVVQAIKEYKANPNRGATGNGSQTQQQPQSQQAPVQQQQTAPPAQAPSGTRTVTPPAPAN